MSEEGIVRRLDDLGRVVIPVEMRKIMNVNDRGYVRIFKQNNSIIIKKYSKSCAICGSERELSEFKDICLRRKCIQQIGKIN